MWTCNKCAVTNNADSNQICIACGIERENSGIDWKLVAAVAATGLILPLAETVGELSPSSLLIVRHLVLFAAGVLTAWQASSKYFQHGFLGGAISSMLSILIGFGLRTAGIVGTPSGPESAGVAVATGIPYEALLIFSWIVSAVWGGVAAGVFTSVVSSVMGKMRPLAFGIPAMVMGVVLVTLSQLLEFSVLLLGQFNRPFEDNARNTVLSIGVTAFILGGFFVAKGVVMPPQNRKTSVSSSNADELFKLKNLLDQGAITQDEYDSQKGKLLS